MNYYTKEILVSILIILLFYLIINKNNVIVINPSKDQMANVSYQADDINDIDFSFKETLKDNDEVSNNKLNQIEN